MIALCADALKTKTFTLHRRTGVSLLRTSFALRIEEIKMKTLKLDFCLERQLVLKRSYEYFPQNSDSSETRYSACIDRDRHDNSVDFS